MPNAEEIIIIEGLKAGGMIRRRFENLLWEKYKGFIYWGTTRYQLPKDEIRLAYDDAICSVIINIVTDRYVPETNILLKTYAEAIFHRKCIDHMEGVSKRSKQTYSVRESIKHPQAINESLIMLLPNDVKSTIEHLIEAEDRLKMNRCLEKLGATCREILMLFGGSYKDREIAELMQYSSPSVAKQTRYRCLEKLSEMYLNLQ